jgi:hypothetical protein
MAMYHAAASPSLSWSLLDAFRTRFFLRLKFVPGGVKEVRVPVTGVEPAAVEPVKTHVVARHGTVVALQTGTFGPTSTLTGRFATLRLWRADPAAPFTVAWDSDPKSYTRPVLTGETSFRLGRLRPGRYVWSVTVNGKTLDRGTLETPCQENGAPANGRIARYGAAPAPPAGAHVCLP